jgi:hypothetical protein
MQTLNNSRYISDAKDIASRFEILSATNILCRTLFERLFVALMEDGGFSYMRWITKRMDQGLALPDLVALAFLEKWGEELCAIIECGEDKWFVRPLWELCTFLRADLSVEDPKYAIISKIIGTAPAIH